MEVKLRERGGKRKTTLSLAIWNPDARRWSYEKLRLYLYRGAGYEEQNKETRKLAEIIRTKRQAEIHSGDFGLIPEHKKRGDFVLFFDGLANERDANWKQTLRVLRRYTKGPLSFRALDASWLVDFQRNLKKNYANNSAWLFASKVRAAIKIAVQKRLIQRNFLIEAPPIRYQQTQRTFLTAEEIEKLANTPCENNELKRAFLFSCFSGLRYSDVSALTWRNIEKNYIRFTQKKTGEPERLPLTTTARQILFPEDEKIISIESDKKIFDMLTAARNNQILKIWAKQAGIDKNITFHVARHSYAFLLLTSGVDLYDTSKALGHRSINMTMIYAHLIPEQLRKKIDEKLPTFNINIGAK